MKTLKELNSKWYWRLIKSIYFIGLLIVFIGIVSEVFYENSMITYSPGTIKILENKVEEERNKIKAVNGKYSHITTGEISRDELVKLNATPEEIRILFSLDKKIEGLSILRDSYKFPNIINCDEKIEKYLKNTNYYEDDILIDSCGINELKAITFYAGGYYNEEIYYYLFQKLSPENHFSYLLLIGNLFQCIGYMIIFGGFTYLIRIFLFYVIFGNISPPK